MVSTFTSLHLSMDPAMSAALAALATVLLIALLLVSELVSTMEGRRGLFGRYLNVAILPLLVAFGVTVVLRIADALKG
jgi:hypothetical protein